MHLVTTTRGLEFFRFKMINNLPSTKLKSPERTNERTLGYLQMDFNSKIYKKKHNQAFHNYNNIGIYTFPRQNSLHMPA